MITAASQLPEIWERMPKFIASTAQSPAARRLALYLLHAIYIMGPQLGNRNSFSNPIFLDELFGSLYSTIEHSSSRPILFDQDRLTCAIFIALLAGCHLAFTVSSSEPDPLRLRPQRANLLLGYISDVMQRNRYTLSSILPIETLDFPQFILLKWGNVIAWAWSVWADPNLYDAELIVHMTITWMYHIDKDASLGISECLEYNLKQDVASAKIAFLHVLQHIAVSLCRLHDGGITMSSVLMIILSRSCSTILFLSKWDAQRHIEAEDNWTIDLGKCMLLLSCVLCESEAELDGESAISPFNTLSHSNNQ
ncbi:hypothetical protein BDQ12DRAFT_419089 [Crucibulum laeve]|uniref:Uncharacterized protein n=1 Tax=Crucibulum laeve TaxID=68775 RepID=A0A5C3M6P7_9AGAR|nr:hypothetical protein BDQ12DRAFT_419089 [Crucibulum laeve]